MGNSVSTASRTLRKRVPYATNVCANVATPDEIENETEKAKPPQTVRKRGFAGSKTVPGDRIELPTRGFSVLCSTD